MNTLEEAAKEYADEELDTSSTDIKLDNILNGINYLIDGFNAPQYHSKFYRCAESGEYIKTDTLTTEKAYNDILHYFTSLMQLKEEDHIKLEAHFTAKGYDIEERFNKAGFNYSSICKDLHTIKRRDRIKVVLTGLSVSPLFLGFFSSFMTFNIAAIMATTFMSLFIMFFYGLTIPLELNMIPRGRYESYDSYREAIQAEEKNHNKNPFKKAILNPEFKNRKVVEFLTQKNTGTNTSAVTIQEEIQISQQETDDALSTITFQQVFQNTIPKNKKQKKL